MALVIVKEECVGDDPHRAATTLADTSYDPPRVFVREALAGVISPEQGGWGGLHRLQFQSCLLSHDG